MLIVYECLCSWNAVSQKSSHEGLTPLRRFYVILVLILSVVLEKQLVLQLLTCQECHLRHPLSVSKTGT